MSKKQQSEETRLKILAAAAQEIYRVGYQAASISDILSQLDVSKGAIYHHFPNKKALGYAVIDEVFTQELLNWFEPALLEDNPLAGIINVLADSELINQEIFTLGCPMNNIAQEMSGLDEDFRQLIEQAYQDWHQRLTRAFERAVKAGYMHADNDLDAMAWMIMSVYQGAIGLAKSTHNVDILLGIAHSLSDYLKGKMIEQS